MIKVKHPNGYVGTLYGKSSLSISKDGKEVFHTGYRRVETKEEVYQMLGEMPMFLEILESLEGKLGGEEDE